MIEETKAVKVKVNIRSKCKRKGNNCKDAMCSEVNMLAPLIALSQRMPSVEVTHSSFSMLAASRLSIWRLLIPKVKVHLKTYSNEAQLKTDSNEVSFANEFGHHFKHYG